MSHPLRIGIALLLAVVIAKPVHAQDAKDYALLSFDDKGQLEDAKTWAKLKTDLEGRKPAHVSLVAHGWRTSKGQADETFSYFGKLLREQQAKDESIAVIGFRWPSLIGENETATDVAFKQVAKSLATAIAESETVAERKDKLKAFLKKGTTRFLVANLLKYQLPDNDQIDTMIDQYQEPENVEKLLTMFSYYEMKRRASVVGAEGMQKCLSELQEKLPSAKFHLVGHSFGCKVCLECLTCKARGEKQVDSVTLLQGAVSMYCFAPKVAELDDAPGAYVDAPKRVKGSISVTFTKNDGALRVAYVAASQSAGQIAESPVRKYKASPTLYGALGGKGIAGVPGIMHLDWTPDVKLRPGLNALNADKVINDHGHIRQEAVARLIWVTARQ